MLVKSGMEVWLVDKNGHEIQHGHQVYLPVGMEQGSEISADVSIEAGQVGVVSVTKISLPLLTLGP